MIVAFSRRFVRPEEAAVYRDGVNGQQGRKARDEDQYGLKSSGDA
jgi:hypothetical protein